MGSKAGVLTKPQLNACADYFSGLFTNQQLADKYGVSRNAINDWRNLPAWKAEYERLVEEHRLEARARLRSLTGKAHAVVDHALDLGVEHKAADRLRAAEMVYRTTGIDTPAPAPVAAVAVVTPSEPKEIADKLQGLIASLLGTSSPAPDEIDDEEIPADG